MTPTRTSLIQRVRNPEDSGSWREFFELYEPLLVSYVRSRGLGHDDARDVVQDVFIALLRALPDFSLDHDRGKFRTWLYQITINRVRDFERRRAALRKHAVQHAELAPQEAATDQPDEEWLAAHRRRVLEFVLPKVQASSQPRTWHCFEQQVLRSRKTAEIAAELGITANAVCVNAGRVLEKVRALCADYMEDLDDE
jgi:RNA polymerase sigma-70 factor (ECF subfamily)